MWFEGRCEALGPTYMFATLLKTSIKHQAKMRSQKWTPHIRMILSPNFAGPSSLREKNLSAQKSSSPSGAGLLLHPSYVPRFRPQFRIGAMLPTMRVRVQQLA